MRKKKKKKKKKGACSSPISMIVMLYLHALAYYAQHHILRIARFIGLALRFEQSTKTIIAKKFLKWFQGSLSVA
jgi:hypothetical protein